MQERGLRGLPRPPGLPDLPRQGKEGRRQQAEAAQEELLLQGKAQQAADAVHRRGAGIRMEKKNPSRAAARKRGAVVPEKKTTS